MTRYGDIARLINGLRSPHGSIELHGTLYFPCALALRLISCSPRRRIRLVTVAGGLRFCRTRLGSQNLRQLDTSNGCQDHTVLPYASASFVCVPLIAHGRTALRSPCAPTLPRPPQPVPTFVTMANAPCLGTGWDEF